MNHDKRCLKDVLDELRRQELEELEQEKADLIVGWFFLILGFLLIFYLLCKA